MLLMVEALLLISAALLQDRRAVVEEQIYPLDMALNSVDDQYMGCARKMADKVKTYYLEKERSASAEFDAAWKEGEKKAKRIWNIFRKLKKKHLVAIYVYTDAIHKLHLKFNCDTRNGKQDYTDKTYKWYSLHFLLTEAIQILKKEQKNKCYHTFRGTKVEFEIKSKIIRFGSFTSSSLNQSTSKSIFGSKSCFEIYTCEGANVTKYSKLRHEEEVLIPPYETFRVIDVMRRKDQKDLWCETVYKLESSGRRSDLNCALFKKPYGVL